MGKNQGAKYKIRSYPMSPDPIFVYWNSFKFEPYIRFKKKKKSTKNI